MGKGAAEPNVWQLIWELAALAGMDPGPMTLRELVWAAEGRQAERWDHTATLLALQANCHRDPKRRSRPFEPADFHPRPERLRRRRKPQRRAGASVLRAVFVDGELPDELLKQDAKGQ